MPWNACIDVNIASLEDNLLDMILFPSALAVLTEASTGTGIVGRGKHIGKTLALASSWYQLPERQGLYVFLFESQLPYNPVWPKTWSAFFGVV